MVITSQTILECGKKFESEIGLEINTTRIKVFVKPNGALQLNGQSIEIVLDFKNLGSSTLPDCQATDYVYWTFFHHPNGVLATTHYTLTGRDQSQNQTMSVQPVLLYGCETRLLTASGFGRQRFLVIVALGLF